MLVLYAFILVEIFRGTLMIGSIFVGLYFSSEAKMYGCFNIKINSFLNTSMWC